MTVDFCMGRLNGSQHVGTAAILLLLSFSISCHYASNLKATWSKTDCSVSLEK